MQYKIGIVGFSGKVGRALLNQLDENEFDIVLKANSQKWEVMKTPHLIVNISAAKAFDVVLDYCLAHKVGLIEGTSGLGEASLKKLSEASKIIPILRADNFSYGHFLQQSIISHLSGIINKELDYHLAVNERHAINKKDAPSATAKKLAHICEQHQLNSPTINYTRCGGPVSDHQIYLTMEGEELIITHGVSERTAVVRGIEMAITWFKEKQIGYWTMENVYQQN